MVRNLGRIKEFEFQAQDNISERLPSITSGLNFYEPFDGTINKCMYFTGSSSYVTVPTSTVYDFGTEDFMIEYWVSFNSFATYNPPVSVGTYTNGILLRTNSNTIWDTYFQYSQGRVQYSTTSLINTWYHYAISRISGTFRAYLNGVQLGSDYTPATVTINTGGNITSFGKSTHAGGEFLTGYMKEVRFWRGVQKTQSEIQKYMYRAPDFNEKGLVGYWPLTSISNSRTEDMSIYKNHGTIISTTIVDSDVVNRSPVTINPHGISVDAAATNSGGDASFGIYNNHGADMVTTVEETNEFYGVDRIWKTTFRPITTGVRDNIRATVGNHGVMSAYIAYDTNKRFASVIWKSDKKDLYIDGGPANSVNWYNDMATVDLENGWKKSICSSTTSSGGDWKYWGFQSTSCELNETITIYWVQQQIEYGIYPSAYTPTSRTFSNGALTLRNNFVNSGCIAFRVLVKDLAASDVFLTMNNNRLYVAQEPNGGRLYLYGVNSAGGQGTLYDGAATFSNNTWYHICVNWDTTTLKLYLNGILKYTYTDWGYTYMQNQNIYLGCESANGRVGRADFKDLAVYNRYLSDSEVLSLSGNKLQMYPTGNITSARICERELTNCLWFDGVDDHVLVAPNAVLNAINGSTAPSNVYTIEAMCWLMVDNTTYGLDGLHEYGIMGKAGQGTAYTGGYGFQHAAGKFNFMRRGYGNFSTVMTPSLGRWYHVVMVNNDNGYYKVYINGALDTCNAGSYNLVTHDACSFHIGWFKWVGNDAYNFFPGMIRNVRVWNIARSQEDIIRDAEYVHPNTPGLVAYYRLDEGTGSVAYDLTSNANHGTIYGATWKNINYESPITRPTIMREKTNKIQIRDFKENRRVAFGSLVNCIYYDNKLTKTTGTDGSWDAGAFGLNGLYDNIYLQFQVSSTVTHKMIGLSSTNVDASYGTIQYAFYLHANANMYIYRSGVQIGDTLGTYTTSTIFRMVVENGYVKWYKDGILRYTYTTPNPNWPLYVDCSLYNLNDSFRNVITSSY